MSRRVSNKADGPGQDSFLDIVANLVGILIILVIVVGFRAKDAMENSAPLLAIERQAAPDIKAARDAAAAVEVNIVAIESKIKREDFEIAFRRKERDKLQVLVSTIEHEVQQRREKMDSQQRDDFDQQRELSEAESELQKLNQRKEMLRSRPDPVQVIKHLPTPMAKTVFGRELNFRISNKRILFIPWDELLEKVKEVARQSVWKLRSAESLTETIGPVRNFLIKYTLTRASYATETRAGVSTQNRIEFDRVEFSPVSDEGESVEQALHPDSVMGSVLSRYDPSRTTITLWVYPDSFGEFRTLKTELFKRGFLTAARPMPEGHAIGASRRGARSKAQ